MKALICNSHGTVADLVLGEPDDPSAKEGEVVVDVVAASLNFPDTLIVAGKYQIRPELPFVVGGEAAGIVSEVGAGVEGYDVGDRVAAVGSTGAFAEKMVKTPAELVKIPDSMDFQTAAGFCVAYGTSYYALRQCGKLVADEKLLVLGAGGGVGLAAVDIGQALGAQVIAAASTDKKLAIAMQQGAVATINYSEQSLKNDAKELTAGEGVDVIYDPVGGELSEMALRAIAWDGRFLVVGFAAGEIPKLPLNLPLLKNCHVSGVFFGAWAQREHAAYRQNFTDLFALYDDGKLTPYAHQVFDLDDYEKAFEELTSRRAMGKVILDIG